MSARQPQHTPIPCPPGPATADLEQLLSAVETGLEALGVSMKRHDSDLIERHAGDLREALARAIDGFTRASHARRVPPTLRARLLRASGQVAAQRESLTRATVALDGVMDVLLPRARAVVYAQPGPRTSSRLFTHGS